MASRTIDTRLSPVEESFENLTRLFSRFQPTVDNQYGTKNNVVEVKESDFNFLNALEQDIANSKHKPDSTGAGSDVSCTTTISFIASIQYPISLSYV